MYLDLTFFYTASLSDIIYHQNSYIVSKQMTPTFISLTATSLPQPHTSPEKYTAMSPIWMLILKLLVNSTSHFVYKSVVKSAACSIINTGPNLLALYQLLHCFHKLSHPHVFTVY